MGFSDNAIGFYLEIENAGFSSTLKGAEKEYGRFVKLLDKHNTAAFRSASGSLAMLRNMVETAGDLPRRAAASMKTAGRKLDALFKPITQRINLEMNAKSLAGLKRAVSQAVADSLSGVKIRLSPSRPQQRLQMFDTSLSLRAAYERMPQPPDFAGQLKPKKYKKGGIVEGPQKTIDSVLALLQPGELVVPADITKQLSEVAGTLRSKSGKFTKSDELATALAEIENLSAGLKKLRKAMDGGLGDKKAMEDYTKGVRLLEKRVGSLDELTVNLALSTRVKLAPSIEEATKSLDEFVEKGDEAETVFDRLFMRVLNPVRYLAMRQALSDVSETFRTLRSDVSSTYTEIAGTQIGDSIDNLNKLNMRWGLTREELLAVKIESRLVLKEMGTNAVSFDQLTASMVAANDAGVTNRDMLFALAKTGSLAAEGLGVAADAVIGLGFDLTTTVGLQQQQFDGIVANIGQLTSRTNGFSANAEDVLARVTSTSKLAGNALRALGAKDAQNVVTSLAQIDAALTTTFIDSQPILEDFARALEGGPQNMESVMRATQLTGLSMDELRERLVKGDVAGLFDNVAESARGMDPAMLSAYANAIGSSADDIGKFDKQQASLNATLSKSSTVLVSNADATQVMTDRAINNKTAFQQWRTSFTNWLDTTSVYGVTLGDMVDVTKEFNVSTLLSIGYLTKWGVAGIGAALKGGAKLLPVLGKLGGLFGGGKKGVVGGLTSITSAGGAMGKGAGGGGAIAGLMQGLSTGLSAMGKGLVAFGTAMIGPGGLGLLAFVGTVIALAYAARLASPALEVFGGIVGDIVDGVVEVAQGFMQLDPARMLAAGPGLLLVGAGFSAVGLGLIGAGTGAGIAAVGFGLLAAATGSKLKGGGISGIVHNLIEDFMPLAEEAPRLERVSSALETLLDFLGTFAKVSIKLTALGGVTMAKNAVGSVLGIFGIDSPIEHLAKRSSTVSSTVGMMLANFSGLSQYTPEMLKGTTRSLSMMLGFLGDYAKLNEAIDALPGLGTLDRISASIGDLLGVDSPAERLAANAEPVARAMQSILSRFASLQELTQSQQAVQPASNAEIREVIDFSVEQRASEAVTSRLDKHTALLMEMVDLLKRQAARSEEKPEPSTRPIAGPSRGSDFARSVAGNVY